MFLPFSVATNFVVNNKEVLIPFAQEESSVVAAASNAAKSCRESGGFIGNCKIISFIGQIQIVNLKIQPNDSISRIESHKNEIIQLINGNNEKEETNKKIVDITSSHLPSKRGDMIIVKIEFGSSLTKNECDQILQQHILKSIESISFGTIRTYLVNPISPKFKVQVTAIWKKSILYKSTNNNKDTTDQLLDVVDHILNGWAFAEADPFRAATHNKGIMNGIDGVVRATGNDTSLIEALAHSSTQSELRKYSSITYYERTSDSDLKGTINLYLPSLQINSENEIEKTAIKLMNIQTEEELAIIIGAVGLAQNLGALWALATEGIQSGHMRLHSKNIAVMGGAKSNEEIDFIVKLMNQEKNVSVSRAKEILNEYQQKKDLQK